MANKEVLEYLGTMRQAYGAIVERETLKAEEEKERRARTMEAKGIRGLWGRMQNTVRGPVNVNKAVIKYCADDMDTIGRAMERLEVGDSEMAADFIADSVQHGVQAIVYTLNFEGDGLPVLLLATKTRRELDLLIGIKPEVVKAMSWERGILNWD